MIKPLIPINQVGLEDIAESLLVPIPTDEANVGITSTGQYLTLQNLVCKDADGNIFEQYDPLYIPKDIVRKADKNQVNNTPYQWVAYFEGQNNFLPSFALSCNIIAALFQAAVEKLPNGTYRVKDEEVKKVLDQYKNKGSRNGYHAQNSIVDYKKGAVIHYPNKAEFSQSSEINSSRPRTSLSFSKATLQDSLLADALRDAGSVRYIRQLTGLTNPAILVDIGTYFEKPARLWFSWIGQAGATFTEKRAAWFGCSNANLNLSAGGDLYSNNAARGVRLGAP